MQAMNAEQISLAAKLYNIRDTARRHYADRWPQYSADWQRLIHACMEQRNIGTLEAAQVLADSPHASGLDVATIIGAAVEMIEGEHGRTNDRP